jgi:cell shape-determining protein MreC
MMAFSAVKSGVAAYKEIKQTGGEVVKIVNELSGALGSFFDHQEQAKKVDEELKKNPPKGKSLQAIALENVLRRKQLEQAEYDLRQMLVYESPPELGAVWTEFEAEKSRLVKEQAAIDKAQKKRKYSNHTKDVCDTIGSRLGLQYVSQYLWWLSPSVA